MSTTTREEWEENSLFVRETLSPLSQHFLSFWPRCFFKNSDHSAKIFFHLFEMIKYIFLLFFLFS
uniref:Uncharacterized protein n=1 Tax=Meloidogyne enterolobii TaxID=390850 RepID=A0A6V7TIY2_MELEN|nr:unnamed protein product [Meloidogyne enterolobii]